MLLGAAAFLVCKAKKPLKEKVMSKICAKVDESFLTGSADCSGTPVGLQLCAADLCRTWRRWMWGLVLVTAF